jgi:hypothetical protein
MNSDKKDDIKENSVKKPPVKEGGFNEFSGIFFSSSIKIFDPNTNEVLVHKRGDN